MNASLQGVAGEHVKPPANLLRRRWLAANAFMSIAVLAWLAPGIAGLATRYWTTTQGAAGPIILATGIWAVSFDHRRLRALARPGSTALVAWWLAGSVSIYIVARMAGILSLECLAAYAALLAIYYAYSGGPLIRRIWPSLVYMLCAIPLPYAVEAGLTTTLKVNIAQWAVELLSALGFDVANSGSSLYIDQYELLVEAACSGLNSIFSLAAIGIFYIYWQRRGGWGVALVLAALIVPIAIATNFARVVLLLLLVHAAGDRVLATAIHPAIGFAMFVVALGLLIGIDHMLSRPGERTAA